jgi:2Fe-2S ferredoxin
MPRITFIQPDGSRRTVEAGDAPSLMHVAIRHDIPRLPAECGGQLACATCMLEAALGFEAAMGTAGEDERDMLEDSFGAAPAGRRLSCQVPVTPALDGLQVCVPERQG